MNPSDDLLNFLVRKKIPLQVAIDILKKAKKELNENWREREKVVVPIQETPK